MIPMKVSYCFGNIPELTTWKQIDDDHWSEKTITKRKAFLNLLVGCLESSQNDNAKSLFVALSMFYLYCGSHSTPRMQEIDD